MKDLISIKNPPSKSRQAMETKGMEMDSCQIMSKEKLEFLDTLKEALGIFKKNINLVVFSILSSFPCFCFLVLFEIVLQRTVLDASKFLEQPRYYSYFSSDDWPVPYSESGRLIMYLSQKLIYLFLLYLVPYHLLELFNMILTVHITSRIYAGETPVSVKEMVRSSNKTRFKSPFITSLYVLFLSTSALLGLFWIVANYYIVLRGSMISYHYYYSSTRSFVFDALMTLLHGAAFAALLVKYLDWSAGWNMSLVISVVEEAYGIDAVDLSAYYSRGSKLHGLLLMLVFLVWGVVSRLPCIFLGCSSESVAGIGFTAIYSGLICVGTVIKWVAFVLYFFDCKRRVLEKKFDEEVGTEAANA